MSPSVSDNVLVDRYELIEPIGTGGMAEVHRAWDTVLRRHVAIKLFHPGFDPAGAQRFDNEVRVLAGLSHPGLVAVYDADTAAPTPFVVLRLVEGRTLHERLTLGPLPPHQVRRLGHRLSDALAHVHDHGLVHRDVKPSNILLDHDGEAYLADFGLAHLTGATRLTRTDHLVGTAAYLAPEQVLGGEVDHPADVYALGLVLLECLTGRREYEGGDVEAAVARLHRPPTIPADLPEDVRSLLAAMTSSAPHDRPTAHDCARTLGTDLLPFDGTAEPGGPAEPGGGEATAKLPVGTRRSWKTLAASAGALVGAFAITMAATSGEPPETSVPPGSSTEQAATEQPRSTDTPRGGVEPQFVGTPQTPDATQAPGTTQPPTPAQDGDSAGAPVDTAPDEAPLPETGPGDTTAPTTAAPTTAAPTTTAPTTAPTTTETIPTTTDQQTSAPSPPDTTSPEAGPSSAEPPGEPADDGT
ncbi:protein kinase domain-containing protein [Saccharothrix isguenensis]